MPIASSIRSFFPVQSEDSFIEVTFHYQNGEAEGFDIPVTPEAFQEQLQGLLEPTLVNPAPI
jgi:hypothetical protein